MNIANKLTILRVCLIPFFVIFLLYKIFGEVDRYIALAIFVIASLTDLLDGILARKYKLITDFGKFMDPLADKLLVCSALVCFIELNSLPAWIVIIIISREFIISGFRLVAANRGIVIAASWWGKYKTVSQITLVILLIADFDFSIFIILEQVFIYVALILTILSLVDYLIKNKSVFKEGSIT